MQLILISGLSGSGKSIALNVLEDAGYYCVDNLPAPLMPRLVEYLAGSERARVAVAIDMRGGAATAALPEMLQELREETIDLRFIFLDARDDVLIQRFSETRRRHPLADEATTLAEAIAGERRALDPIASLGHRVDTSNLRPNTLRAYVKGFAELDPGHGLTLTFVSFGFKHGLPLDADMVFDVRCLPNPHYESSLRPLTGLDQPVIDFLEASDEVRKMTEDIRRYIADWLPCFIRDNRSYLTVALGCTGGQHRSVYMAEWLARHFRDRVRVLVRHRIVTE